jgi:hypothetical protein
MRLPNGGRMWVHNDNAGHLLLPYLIGRYEYQPTRVFLKCLNLLQPTDCVMDIGANVGYYAIMAAYQRSRVSGGKVFAFEPNPLAFQYLQQNARLNALDNLIALPWAVTISIDEFMAQHPESRIGLMKVDIEGAEMSAFIGGKETLCRDRPIILYEERESSYKAFGYSPYEARAFLQDLGYRLYEVSLESGVDLYLLALPEEKIQHA